MGCCFSSSSSSSSAPASSSSGTSKPHSTPSSYYQADDLPSSSFSPPHNHTKATTTPPHGGDDDDDNTSIIHATASVSQLTVSICDEDLHAHNHNHQQVSTSPSPSPSPSPTTKNSTKKQRKHKRKKQKRARRRQTDGAEVLAEVAAAKSSSQDALHGDVESGVTRSVRTNTVDVAQLSGGGIRRARTTPAMIQHLGEGDADEESDFVSDSEEEMGVVEAKRRRQTRKPLQSFTLTAGEGRVIARRHSHADQSRRSGSTLSTGPRILSISHSASRYRLHLIRQQYKQAKRKKRMQRRLAKQQERDADAAGDEDTNDSHVADHHIVGVNPHELFRREATRLNVLQERQTSYDELPSAIPEARSSELVGESSEGGDGESDNDSGTEDGMVPAMLPRRASRWDNDPTDRCPTSPPRARRSISGISGMSAMSGFSDVAAIPTRKITSFSSVAWSDSDNDVDDDAFDAAQQQQLDQVKQLLREKNAKRASMLSREDSETWSPTAEDDDNKLDFAQYVDEDLEDDDFGDLGDVGDGADLSAKLEKSAAYRRIVADDKHSPAGFHTAQISESSREMVNKPRQFNLFFNPIWARGSLEALVGHESMISDALQRGDISQSDFDGLMAKVDSIRAHVIEWTNKNTVITTRQMLRRTKCGDLDDDAGFASWLKRDPATLAFRPSQDYDLTLCFGVDDRALIAADLARLDGPLVVRALIQAAAQPPVPEFTLAEIKTRFSLPARTQQSIYAVSISDGAEAFSELFDKEMSIAEEIAEEEEEDDLDKDDDDDDDEEEDAGDSSGSLDKWMPFCPSDFVDGAVERWPSPDKDVLGEFDVKLLRHARHVSSLSTSADNGPRHSRTRTSTRSFFKKDGNEAFISEFEQSGAMKGVTPLLSRCIDERFVEGIHSTEREFVALSKRLGYHHLAARAQAHWDGLLAAQPKDFVAHLQLLNALTRTVEAFDPVHAMAFARVRRRVKEDMVVCKLMLMQLGDHRRGIKIFSRQEDATGIMELDL